MEKLGYLGVTVKFVRRIVSKIFKSYGRVWDLHVLVDGIKSIRPVAGDEKDFALLGELDANHLKTFIEPNLIVLDIGCGIGRVEKYLATHCKEIHGVDASRVMIRKARKRLEACDNVFFYKTNGRDLSIFPDGKFDFVFSLFLFQHLDREDTYFYLLEIHRLLKPSGKAYLQFANLLDDGNIKMFTEQVMMEYKSHIRMRFFTQSEVKKLLQTAGFNIISFINPQLTTNRASIYALVSPSTSTS